MFRRIGAPSGGRVHWMLFNLPHDFKKAYRLSYDYATHNYIFYRMDGYNLFDIFIVVQTSRHYWRVTYANTKKQVYENFGYRNTRLLAEKMVELYYDNL